MDSVETDKCYVETELSDSLVLVEDELEADLDQNKLEYCKVYHSCCLHDPGLTTEEENVINELAEEEEGQEEDDEDDEVEVPNTVESGVLVNLDEEECIELKIPEWTQEIVHNQTLSDSDCESKCTNLTSLDDSMLANTTQPPQEPLEPLETLEHQNQFDESQGHTNLLISKTDELTLNDDLSDLEDKTDLSGSNDLIDDNDGNGVDTVDSISNRKPFNDSSDETVGLLMAEQVLDDGPNNGRSLIDNEQAINDKIEIHTKGILISLTDPLAGNKDDQMSLVTKHSTQLYRHTNYPVSCSTSASSASSSSFASLPSTSRQIAKRARKVLSEQVNRILKKSAKKFK